MEATASGAAVHIETVAGGDYEGDDLARHAERFHALHGARQGRLRGARGEGDGGRFGDGAKKTHERQASEKNDGQEHAEQECGQRRVGGQHQLSERQEHAHSQMAHGVSHGCTDADGCVIHDDVGELEHDLREGFREIEDGSARGSGDERQGYGEKNGEHGDLQDLILGGGFDDIFREHVKQEVVPAKRRVL
jgi:hypothetical protein